MAVLVVFRAAVIEIKLAKINLGLWFRLVYDELPRFFLYLWHNVGRGHSELSYCSIRINHQRSLSIYSHMVLTEGLGCGLLMRTAHLTIPPGWRRQTTPCDSRMRLFGEFTVALSHRIHVCLESRGRGNRCWD